MIVVVLVGGMRVILQIIHAKTALSTELCASVHILHLLQLRVHGVDR